MLIIWRCHNPRQPRVVGSTHTSWDNTSLHSRTTNISPTIPSQYPAVWLHLAAPSSQFAPHPHISSTPIITCITIPSHTDHTAATWCTPSQLWQLWLHWLWWSNTCCRELPTEWTVWNWQHEQHEEDAMWQSSCLTSPKSLFSNSHRAP